MPASRVTPGRARARVRAAEERRSTRWNRVSVTREKLMELLSEGVEWSALAERYGCSVESLRRICETETGRG